MYLKESLEMSKLMLVVVFLLSLICTIASSKCPSDWSSLNSTSIANVEPACFSSLKATDLSLFTSNECAVLSLNQITELGALNNGSTCSGMNLDCFQAIGRDSFTGISGDCMAQLHSDLFYHITADQALSISRPAAVLSVEKMKNLILSTGEFIVSQFSSGQMKGGSQMSSSFHQYWSESPFFKAIHSACQGEDLLSNQWLDLSFSFNNSVSCITSGISTAIGETVAGLRSGHSPFTPLSFFKTMDSMTMSLLSDDFVSTVSAAQIKEIPCTSFGGLDLKFLNISTEVLPYVSTQQLHTLVTDAKYRLDNMMPCSSLRVMSRYQLDMLNLFPQFYKNVLRCSLNYAAYPISRLEMCPGVGTEIAFQ